jgi:hypothetical protein
MDGGRGVVAFAFCLLAHERLAVGASGLHRVYNELYSSKTFSINYTMSLGAYGLVTSMYMSY